ncbi:FGGY-family carbohydrate kinase [Sporosarcina thermotolerans]|uniref:FGGY-family carbohydrate kinase n=1 Tax=Sporosarcina thermotolerans TaxID=633404 RepID=A0AAW9A6A8_9BACL|nr:FGGY-family carbohydrate kinase [Sporosarcina thermotolerans]MDW0116138.1 FGGY-family carbohydrate kinase [Sporosarcina thermotolerans]WHT48109.1 FGGY-family carbohydrate kinase [Sporosarcina thermotolerans]
MKKNYIVTIDAGTTNLKVSLFHINGTIINSIVRSVHMIQSGNERFELDMTLLWEKVASSIRELIEQTAIHPSSILNIGITGQGEGCWLVDSQYMPVRNAILWMDKRAAKLLSEIPIDEQLNYEAITYSGLVPGSTIALLKWLDKNEPSSLSKAKWCLTCKDWIRLKLTSVARTDYSDISTSMLDMKFGKVSSEVFDLLEIPHLGRLIPPIHYAGENGGTITEEAASLTGLLEGTPVVIGSLDIIANALGSGAINEGEISITIGTTCSIQRLIATLPPNHDGKGSTQFGASPGQYLKMAGSMAGTPNIDWITNVLYETDFRDQQEKDDFFALLDDEMKAVPIGAGGVLYHPYIMVGERAPFYNPYASAQFFGIQQSTSKAHLSRAVYEGIALSIRDCLDSAIGVKRIVLNGGGSNSVLLPQIIADCTGTEVVKLVGKEITSKGAFFLAAVQSGVYESLDKAVQTTTTVEKSYLPIKENAELYDDLFKLYKQIRTSNIENWELRHQFMNKVKNRVEEKVCEPY